MSYHDTVPETRENVAKYESKARSQEDEIYHFFEMYPGRELSPDYFILMYSWPITSIRRAFTNLEKSGKLVKTENRRMGRYGRMTRTWKLAGGQGKLF